VVPREHLVLLEHKGHKDYLVLTEHLEHQVFKERKVHQVQPEQVELQDLRDQQDHQVNLGFLGHLVLRGYKEHKEQQVVVYQEVVHLRLLIGPAHLL